ncbi:MGMT family protein [Leeia sp. TBRC 13508]|uniref:MGMT family protein n=1 Tax=Leeia speluncae TaxID=2884804 RepID=A0ABS8D7N8_9NEIS|nr:MGMT family protein [Leeia speluncae]MCB6184001.1 MGMT family protein [Leeia speluncae]
MVSAATIKEAVYLVVAAIPSGHVMTYGDIAAMAGWPGRARMVGQLLGSLPEDTQLPWWRVVNAGRTISRRGLTGHDDLQRLILVEEGVTFETNHKIPLRYFYRPASVG